LEQMMVATVDERDVGLDAFQFLNGGKSAKSPTHNDDLRSVGHGLHQSLAPRERYASTRRDTIEPTIFYGSRAMRSGHGSVEMGSLRVQKVVNQRYATSASASLNVLMADAMAAGLGASITSELREYARRKTALARIRCARASSAAAASSRAVFRKCSVSR